MSALKGLAKIDNLNIGIGTDGQYILTFSNFNETKEGLGFAGYGATVEEAAKDYAHKLSGQTMVARGYSERQLTIVTIKV